MSHPAFPALPLGGNQIRERSRLPIMCEPGDSIMADKGFDVQDLFDGSMVTVNIPTFIREKKRVSAASYARQEDRK